MKKEANFIDGVLKEFYYKALDKNIISEESLSKTASVSIDKYAATGNLMQDLVNLASGLRELGLFEQAESLEAKINIFKKAQSAASNLIDQESQALLNKAHPSSTKITDAQDGWGVVHTGMERQNKILQTLLKKNEPTSVVVQNTALAAAEALGLLKSGQNNKKKVINNYNDILKFSKYSTAAAAESDKSIIKKMQSWLIAIASQLNNFIQTPQGKESKFNADDIKIISNVGSVANKTLPDGIWKDRTTASLKRVNDLFSLNLLTDPSVENAKANINILDNFSKNSSAQAAQPAAGGTAQAAQPAAGGAVQVLDVLPSKLTNSEVEYNKTNIANGKNLLESDLNSLNSLYNFLANNYKIAKDLTISQFMFFLGFLKKRANYISKTDPTNGNKYNSLVDSLYRNFYQLCSGSGVDLNTRDPKEKERISTMPVARLLQSDAAKQSVQTGTARPSPGAKPGKTDSSIGGANAPQRGGVSGDLEGTTLPGSSEEESSQWKEAPPFNNNIINLMSKYFDISPDASSLAAFQKRQLPISFFKQHAVYAAQILFQQQALKKLTSGGAQLRSVTEQHITAQAVTIYNNFLIILRRNFTDAANAYIEYLDKRGFPTKAVSDMMMSVNRDINRHLEQIQRWNENPLVLNRQYGQ